MDTRIVIVISAALFSILVISFLFRFILLYQKKTTAFQAEKKLIETRFQQELLSAQLEIQEQTLEHVSQEIHDNIGQTLSLAKLNLNRMEQEPPPAVQHSKELLTKAIADLRALSRSLNTEAILAAGLTRAIETELLQLEKSGAFTTTLDIQGTVYSLPAQQELILFRTVQEALNNIIKHAQATHIDVVARYNQHRLALVIADNGKGFFAPEKMANKDGKSGIGLQNMRKRVQLLKGNFQVQSAPQQGTTIQIEIPA